MLQGTLYTNISSERSKETITKVYLFMPSYAHNSSLGTFGYIMQIKPKGTVLDHQRYTHLCLAMAIQSYAKLYRHPKQNFASATQPLNFQ